MKLDLLLHSIDISLGRWDKIARSWNLSCHQTSCYQTWHRAIKPDRMRDSTDINDGSKHCKSSQDFHVWTYIKPTLKLVATIRTQKVVAAKVTSESICSYQFLKQLMVVKGNVAWYLTRRERTARHDSFSSQSCRILPCEQTSAGYRRPTRHCASTHLNKAIK